MRLTVPLRACVHTVHECYNAGSLSLVWDPSVSSHIVEVECDSRVAWLKTGTVLHASNRGCSTYM